MSTTEVLRCRIVLPTPPYFRSARRPCCSCRRCWPPNDAAAARARAGGRWAATGRRGWCALVLRWFCDGPRLAPLAADNRIGRSTAYRYLHEGIDVLAARAPGLR